VTNFVIYWSYEKIVQEILKQPTTMMKRADPTDEPTTSTTPTIQIRDPIQMG